MKTKCMIHNFIFEPDTNKSFITFEFDRDMREVYEKLKDKLCKLTLVLWRAGRSLDANAYFHVLVTKIAEATDNSKIYVKNKLIAEYGRPQLISGSLVSMPLKEEIEAYELDFVHLQPTSQMTTNKKDELFRVHLVMRGSHTYDTKEMSELIKGTVAEAKELGIETATPQEIKEMEERWRVKLEKAN